ncbi:MAG: hypothetical protein KC646_02385 [Candidatus Cloacimonetes bacterium]|nr:hypothetical protein [Candidatus Cloacimonadota bacterium]
MTKWVVFFTTVCSIFCFEGRLVPVNPVELRAPRFEIRGFGSASSSSSVSLKTRQESGTKVKAGDIVSEFNISAHWVVSRGNRELNLAKSKKREILQKNKQAISEKETEILRAKIDLGQLEVQLVASSVMAKYDLQKLHLDIEIQKINIKDLQEDLLHLKGVKEIQEKYYQIEIDRVLSEIDHVQVQLDRFVTKAPFDGYLFFPHHNQYKRPIKVNDRLKCGSVCAYISTTKSASLEFFVPERFLRQLKVGAKAKVTLVKTGKSYEATIDSWNPFLQILPVIKKNPSILNSYDKFIHVRGNLDNQITSFSEGMEVDVRLEWIQEL